MTRTYPTLPLASRATNFDDFTLGIFTNDLDFAVEALGEGGGGAVFGSAAVGAGGDADETI